MLKSASALEAYRVAYSASFAEADVVEFLLLSRTFPRSVLYAVREAEQQLEKLGTPGALTRPQRMLGRLRADLEYRDVHELLADDVGEFLDRIQEGVRAAADVVAGQFFRTAADEAIHAFEAS